jgi:hypothetical protein
MVLTMAALWLLVAGAQGLSALADPQPAAPLVSIERIRKGLERPQVLTLPNPDEMAYFRVTVEEKLVIDSVLDAMRRDLAARPGRPISAPTSYHAPLAIGAGVELLGLARSVLRWHAERSARRTVQEAIDEFCATHDCSVLEGGSPTPEGVLGPNGVRPPSSTTAH